MCQACWALASRRSGGALFATEDDAAATAPRPRFSAVAEWAAEPAQDDRPADPGPAPTASDRRPETTGGGD